jgi:serine/threonine-protein kinase
MPIPNPSSLNPAVPPSLDAVVHRALARDVNARYGSANEVLDALEKAVPIGSPRDVAAFVERTTGDRLRERKVALRGMLEGRVLPLALDLPLDKDDSQTTLSPQSHSHSQGRVLPNYPSEGSVAIAQKTVLEVPHAHNAKSHAPIAILAAVGSLVFLVVAIVISVVAFRHPTSAADRSSASGSAAAASAPADSTSGATIEFSASPNTVAETPTTTAAALAPGEVALTLHADSPIIGVRMQGVHKLEIQGNSAQIVASKWNGRIRVEATLQGGKTATASVASGTTSADLVTPRTTTTTATPARDPALQANPY